MSTGKENKGWKADFLAWERSGGTTNRENLLWEKLQGRLQPRKPAKKTWLRAAAIVFLVATSCFLFLQQQRPLQCSAFLLKTPADRPVPVKEETVPSIPQAPEKNMTLAVPASTSIPGLPVEGQTDPPSFTEAGKPLVDSVTPVTIQPVVTASAQPVAAPARKKLRVLHLNEWNSPPPPSYATLKETWKMQQAAGLPETNLPERSVWPGKNRNKLPASPNN